MNSGPPPPRDENSFRAPRGGGRSFDNTNRLYVGNLSWDVDNVTLESFFSEQGKVLDAKVVYDRESGRSRGFGFVTYGSSDEVNRAIDNLNGAVSVCIIITTILFSILSSIVLSVYFINILCIAIACTSISNQLTSHLYLLPLSLIHVHHITIS